MTKRLAAIVLFSPIILTVLVLMVLTSCVVYAVTSKWELKAIISQYKEA